MNIKCIFGFHSVAPKAIHGDSFYFCNKCKYIGLLVKHPYAIDFKIVRVDKEIKKFFPKLHYLLDNTN